MFSLKDLEKYTNGKIINGNENTMINNYCVNHEFYINGAFYVPIIFHGINREIYIIESVKLGAIGFMIERTSENYENIIKESKSINPNICILEVNHVNDSICALAKINRSLNINIPIIGVTGSVGKTTMSCLLSNILKGVSRF